MSTAREVYAQLVAALAARKVDLVIDVGANTGQYAQRLRRDGYRGRILSFEPQPAAHAALTKAAEADADWIVAPPMALGARRGRIALEVAAEDDMSSILPQTALLRSISPSSAVSGEIDVALERLDAVLDELAPGAERPFLKLDVQGYEPYVLKGAQGLRPRLAGLQLELALVRLYEGEFDYRVMLDRLSALGFELGLVIPGYYDRRLGRQVQFDGVFFPAES